MYRGLKNNHNNKTREKSIKLSHWWISHISRRL